MTFKPTSHSLKRQQSWNNYIFFTLKYLKVLDYLILAEVPGDALKKRILVKQILKKKIWIFLAFVTPAGVSSKNVSPFGPTVSPAIGTYVYTNVLFNYI